MKKWQTRSVSLLLTASMILPMAPPAIAAEEDTGGTSYFDFEKTEYEVREDGDELEIKIVRHGSGDAAANVSLKIADFLSSYGDDYVIRDSDGKKLTKVFGEKPDFSEFVYEEDEPEEEAPDAESVSAAGDTSDEEKLPAADEPADGDELPADSEPADGDELPADSEPADADELPADSEPADGDELPADSELADEDEPADESASSAENEPTDEDSEKAEPVKRTTTRAADSEEAGAVLEQVTDGGETAPVVSRYSTGSSLLNAAYGYLDLPTDTVKAETENAIGDTLTEVYTYFSKAEGAETVIHFGRGETEKTITVLPNDNQRSDGSRMFMLALMGTDSEETTIAPNATTYVSIQDDEDYETPQYNLDADGITLSKSSPTAEVTVRRTAGTQYFSFAYLSTVSGTAPDDAYVRMSDKAVAFVPGETEKTVTVRAAGFSASGRFGLRLDDQEGERCGYAEIEILGETGVASPAGPSLNDEVQVPENALPETAAPEGAESDESSHTAELFSEPETASDGEASLFAGGITLGGRYSTLGGSVANSPMNDLGGSGRWKEDRTSKGGYVKLNDDKITVMAENWGKYSMAVTKNAYDLTGIYKIRFSSQNDRNGRKRYNGFDTYFETDADQTFNGFWDQKKWTGKYDWQEADLYVRNRNQPLYLKYSTKLQDVSGDFNKSRAMLDWVNFCWTQYSFSPQESAESFSRDIYDFSDGNLQKRPTYFDGQSSRVYTPGTIVVKYGNSTVSGFYGNANKTITITPANLSDISSKGLYLKGVYFAKSSLNANNMCENGRYRTSNVYYVGANGNQVSVTLNQNFVKFLINKGVVNSSNQENESIKIFPVYAQEMVQVNFENADRDDSKTASRGKYNTTYLASHFANILETWKRDGSFEEVKKPSFKQSASYLKFISACNNGKVWHSVSNGIDVYSIKVPKYSVIRLRSIPASNRTPTGAIWWKSGGSANTAFYEKGKKHYSMNNYRGEDITETDFTMAEIVASTDISAKPKTGEQSFYVGYSPKSLSAILNSSDVTSLEGAVVSGELTDTNAQRTNAQGSMWLKDASVGKTYTLTANAPEGYYVSWANLSGDTNNNGTIDTYEAVPKRTDRSNSNNPLYACGNRLNITLDTDNTRYYYLFMPESNKVTVTKTGTVLREKSTFYRLANGDTCLDYKPVAGAYVNIAGFVGQTGLDGTYSVPIRGLPDWGAVSMMVTVEGQNLYSMVELENGQDKTIIPALDRFTAKSTKASYAKETESVNGALVTVEDDTLTVTAQIASASALVPVGARFYIYSSSGGRKVDCSADTAHYRTDFSSGDGKYTAKLQFNPKTHMSTGDTLYVQFCDQNGHYYPEIDMGYTFIARLTMDEFVLPMIGSSSLDDLTTGKNIVTDIIGNPLGDLDVGTISKMKSNSYYYAPPSLLSESKGLDDLNEKEGEKWRRTDYTAGWSKEFDLADEKHDSEKEHKKAMKEYLSKIEKGDTSAVKPEKSAYATKGKYSWKLTPEVGFKLTVSTRSDEKCYFEDLVFYLRMDTTASAENEIALPIGISIVVGMDFSGDAVGIYHMYTSYRDRLETEGRVPYTSEDFGIFKSFSSNVRREGYIFLNPTIAANLGVKYAVVEVGGKASFAFDMDFQFAETGNATYGDMNVKLDWYINLLGFKVYSKNLMNQTVRLFNSDGQDKPINFDYAVETALLEASDNVNSVEGEYSLDTPVPRDYLKNRSGWNSGVSLLSSAADGTSETVLQTGTADNPQMSITKINDREMLMVFVGDDTSRSNVNKRAIFYSIGDGTNWSEPQLLDDDGTLDDYPNVSDLGDDRILVTWSSAEEALPDGATVEDALQSLNLKAAFFDKGSKTFDKVEQLTKTTDEDYTADVLSRAAYSEATDTLILFYTKTEYKNLAQSVENIGEAESLIAYLFYRNGKWENTSDDYTNAEKEEFGSHYCQQWYGQRFLDARIDNSSEKLLRVVDTAAISYNDLALFAWTVDWDNDLTTTDDRDIFMQIYDFTRDLFTHIIRVTESTGTYAAPQFARSDNATYLFYGAKTEDSDNGEIRYLNVSDAIKGEQFTKYTNGSISYYDLKYTYDPNDNADELPVDEAGHVIDLTEEERWVTTETAASCNNISDYCVYVSEEGQLYLFWTESKGSSRQILSALWQGGDNDSMGDVEPSDSSDRTAYWSEPFVLTDAEDTYYLGVSASVIDDAIYIGSGCGSYSDSSDTALVMVKHVPFADASIETVTIDEEYPQPGSDVPVTTTIRNSGMLTYEQPLTVTFSNGSDSVTETYDGAIPGGGSALVSTNLPVPEAYDQLTVTAALTGGSGGEMSVTLTPAAALEFTDSEIISSNGIDGDGAENTYFAKVVNNGSAPSGQWTASIIVGEETSEPIPLPSLAPGESTEINIPFTVPDNFYQTTDDVGTAAVTISMDCGGATVFTFDGYAVKTYDADAIALLQGASAADNAAFTMNPGEEKLLQPKITGASADGLKVEWQSSSDGNVAFIDYSNAVIAGQAGTATLTGILVPKGGTYLMGADGNASPVDWSERIPSGQLQTVTATVTVGGTSLPSIPDDSDDSDDRNENTRPSGSGGSSAYRLADVGQTNNTSNPSESQQEPQPETTAPNPAAASQFTDVSANAYYYDAVQWAVENGVTAGTSPGLFSPDRTCTRAQVVTFLWRASGSPVPGTAVSPFTDVETGSYYEQAMLWAVENGITAGTSPTTFGPDLPCTRAQVVTFLYRTAGSPETAGGSSFADVADGQYYGNAVNWAVEQNITSGTSANTFSPDADCQRSQIVTFLYRYFAQ